MRCTLRLRLRLPGLWGLPLVSRARGTLLLLLLLLLPGLGLRLRWLP